MEPIYNLQKMREHTLDDNGFVKRMVQLFCEVAEETIRNIDSAMAAGNYDVIREYAHKIKSSIDVLEIQELKSKVREIEKAENTSDELFLERVNYFRNRINEIQLLMRKNELADN